MIGSDCFRLSGGGGLGQPTGAHPPAGVSNSPVFFRVRSVGGPPGGTAGPAQGPAGRRTSGGGAFGASPGAETQHKWSAEGPRAGRREGEGDEKDQHAEEKDAEEGEDRGKGPETKSGRRRRKQPIPSRQGHTKTRRTFPSPLSPNLV